MDVTTLLAASSLYLSVIGLATLLFPAAVTPGVWGVSSAVVINILRSLAGAYFAGAIVNWKSRHSEESTVRGAIVLGNIVGFVFASMFGILACMQGHTTLYGWAFVAINALFANSFLIAGVSIVHGHAASLPDRGHSTAGKTSNEFRAQAAGAPDSPALPVR